MQRWGEGSWAAPPPWAYTRHRRPYRSDDVFFQEGNGLAHARHTGLRQGRARAEAEAAVAHSTAATLTCDVDGCTATFTGHGEFEAHYQTAHRHRCRECRRVFTSSRLLSLHLSEWHDTLFALMAERQPMYECLVASCRAVFMTSRLRREHLIQVHSFPKDFYFSKVLGKPAPRRAEAPQAGAAAGDMDTSTQPTRDPRVPKSLSFGRGGRAAFGPKRKSKKTPSNPATCYVCKEEGHIRRDCPVRRGRQPHPGPPPEPGGPERFAPGMES